MEKCLSIMWNIWNVRFIWKIRIIVGESSLMSLVVYEGILGSKV